MSQNEIDEKNYNSSGETMSAETTSQDDTTHDGRTWDSRINFFSMTQSITSGPMRSSSIHDKREEDEDTDFFSETSSSTDLSGWDSDVSWPDLVLPGTWGTQGLEKVPWANWNRPVVNFNDYENIKFLDYEKVGVLTDRIIASCSSYLDQCPEFKQYVLCKCNLSGKSLCDITILSYHHYLQYLDLSSNLLSDLTALGQLPFLMYLDLSHNQLTEVLDFKAPFNLTYVNLSHNFVRTIRDITDFWSIVYLDLSHNEIDTISGLDQLMYLRHLDLSFNYIVVLENLNNMRLQTLNLKYNYINKFEEGDYIGLKTLPELIRITLNHNYLETLRIFDGVNNLQDISVDSNSIKDLRELNYLRQLPYLVQASFKNNPICTMKDYFDTCLNCINALCILDDELVTAADKIKARSKFTNSPRQESIKKEAALLLLKQLHHPVIGPPIVPVSQPPPPVIILVGPPACKKAMFVQEFCDRYKKYTKMGVSHTSRPKREHETEEKTYYFISNENFKRELSAGKFLSVQEHFGYNYGFAHEELNKAIYERSVLVFHTDLVAALTLRAKGLKPRLILAMPRSLDIYKFWLLEKYCYSNWSKYPGALHIENWPENCKILWAESEKLSKAALISMTTAILNEIVDKVVFDEEQQEQPGMNKNVLPKWVEPNHLKLMSSFSSLSQDEKQNQGQQRSETTLGGRYGAMSILKSGPNKARPSAEQGKDCRQSVTFQSETSEGSGSYSEPLGLNRSVTFRCDSDDEIKDVPSPYSASATIIPEADQSTVQLSALSGIGINDTGSRTSNLSYESASRMIMKSKEIQDRLDLVKVFFDECIALRDTYLHMHESNPGLFSAVIYTDEEDNAMGMLKTMLKQCIHEQSTATPVHEYKKDAVYKSMVTKRLSDMQSDIHKYLCVGTVQKCTKSDDAAVNSEHKSATAEFVHKVSSFTSSESNEDYFGLN